MNDMIPYSDLQGMADVMAKSGMFGKSPQQLLALMLIAQAEGLHPARAAQEYDIIQNKPALKSQAALARFQDAGGKIEWIVRSDTVCEAKFSHPQANQITVRWDMARAEKMGLAGKDNWKKQPMIMLQWRVVAEGVRACYPACLNRMYLVEEVQDFEPMRNVTPAPEIQKTEQENPNPPKDRRPLTANEIEFDTLCSKLTEAKADEYYAALDNAKTPEAKTAVLNGLREFVRSIDRTPAEPSLSDDPKMSAIFDKGAAGRPSQAVEIESMETEKPVLEPDLF